MKKKKATPSSPKAATTKGRLVPRVKYRPLEMLALAVLCAWVFFGSVTQARGIWLKLDASRQQHLAMEAHLRLFGKVRQDIGTEPAVGYVSASPGGADYYRVRFALNPVLVLHDLKQVELVVARFPRGVPQTVLDQGLKQVKAYGDGLFLLERAAP